ncbi:MAG: PEP-CTERM sorting domain-containing protein [Phycisphaerae bacterium]
MKKLLCATAVLAFAGSAFAGTAVFNNEVDFVNQLAPGFYNEAFAGYSDGSPFNGSQITADFGPVNGFAWQAGTTGGLGLYSVPNRLSTNNAGDALLITMTGAPVTSVGGIFESTDISGNPIPLDVTITLNNGTTETISSGAGFRGFSTPLPITTITIDGVDGVGVNNWPALGNFYVGNVVPEPASLSLLLLAGAFIRRR